MIVPMYKYSFLVYYAGYSDFLKDLKKLGVVHIDRKVSDPTPEMQELMRHINDVGQAVKKLEWFKGAAESQESPFRDGEAVYKQIR